MKGKLRKEPRPKFRSRFDCHGDNIRQLAIAIIRSLPTCKHIADIGLQDSLYNDLEDAWQHQGEGEGDERDEGR